jgi:hypothetical protein
MQVLSLEAPVAPQALWVRTGGGPEAFRGNWAVMVASSQLQTPPVPGMP